MTVYRFLPILDSAVITVPCGECADLCTSHQQRLPVRSAVLVRGAQTSLGFLVDGIARPTMHGGGVHVTGTHAETGVRAQFIVGDCYTA